MSLYATLSRSLDIVRKNVTIDVIYGPIQQCVNEFLSANNDLLEKVSKENK